MWTGCDAEQPIRVLGVAYFSEHRGGDRLHMSTRVLHISEEVGLLISHGLREIDRRNGKAIAESHAQRTGTVDE